MANNNPLRLKVGYASDILGATNLPQSEVIYGYDKAVFSAFGKIYYGKPTLKYEGNKLTLLGISGDSATTLGEVIIAQGGGGGDDVFENGITVNGGDIGGLKNGQEFSANTTVKEVLMAMLNKVINPSRKSLPSLTIKTTGITQSNNIEVGTEISSAATFTIQCTYNDGKYITFTSSNTQTTTEVNAGCVSSGYQWKHNNEEILFDDGEGNENSETGNTITDNFNKYISAYTINEQKEYIDVSLNYGASTTKIYDNQKNEYTGSSVVIGAGTCTGKTTLTVPAGKERIFIGWAYPNKTNSTSNWGTGGTALDTVIRSATANTNNKSSDIAAYTTLSMVKGTSYNSTSQNNTIGTLFGIASKYITIPEGAEGFIIYPSNCELHFNDWATFGYNELTKSAYKATDCKFVNQPITLCDGGGNAKNYKYTVLNKVGQDIDINAITFYNSTNN